ncbi:hypothetical protein [Endozoicomonas sp. YOMI1]|nr:hypothetical protein [Endozoicomonas sp. YOMI1]
MIKSISSMHGQVDLAEAEKNAALMMTTRAALGMNDEVSNQAVAI